VEERGTVKIKTAPKNKEKPKETPENQAFLWKSAP
jgi:hypothetical protein